MSKSHIGGHAWRRQGIIFSEHPICLAFPSGIAGVCRTVSAGQVLRVWERDQSQHGAGMAHEMYGDVQPGIPGVSHGEVQDDNLKEGAVVVWIGVLIRNGHRPYAMNGHALLSSIAKSAREVKV